MANYCNTGAKWININSNDSKYNSSPELIQPLSPILATNDAGFKWLGPKDNINPLAVEYTNTIEFLNTIIQNIGRLFVIQKPYHYISARIQAVTMHILRVPILTIIALTHISQSQV
jgi:hypothetical protein